MPDLSQMKFNSSVSKPFSKNDGPGNRLTVILSLLAVLTMTILAYAPVLSDCFNGDDFVHLKWLKQATENPELIWRNFHSAWLDVPTARFYRPLISLFMVSDYLFWHRSGFGFHLTNLICHLTSSLFLYLILRQITADRPRWGNLWAAAAGALFAFYPLHPEAVSWITGRVDTIATMFYLASFWLYLKWRSVRRYPWLIGSCIAFALSLLSKEIAATLPPLLFCYELICKEPPLVDNQGKLGVGAIPTRLARTFAPTCAFWLMLCVYLSVRTLALGTLIGGYDNSFLPVGSKREFARTWWHAVSMSLVPLNKGLFASCLWVKWFWSGLIAVCVALGIKGYLVERDDRRYVQFLFAWLVLSLLPIFKLFNITDDLQGSRLAYLPSVPLCALLCFGIAAVQAKPIQRFAVPLLLSTLLISSWAILRTNNGAWQRAGEESRAIIQSLDALYKEMPDDPSIFLLGLPDTHDGAYVCRNALDGMTKWPQISRDVKNCFMLDNNDRIFPFGVARGAIGASHEAPKIFKWNAANNSLVAIAIAKPQSDQIHSWSGEALKQIIDFGKGSSPTWQPDHSGVVISNKDAKHRPEIILNFPALSCFQTEFIEITVQFRHAPDKGEHPTVSLFYTNDLQRDFDLSHRFDAPMADTEALQSIKFPLHGEVNWAMGGDCHSLKLQFPQGYDYVLKSVAVRPSYEMMPQLIMDPAANQNILGFIELNPKQPKSELKFDISNMSSTNSVALEVTKPNTAFAYRNASESDPSATMTKVLQSKHGKIPLDIKDFSVDGIYEIRLRALDRKGQAVGFSGDHILLTISH